jgi:hypothetical protein
METVVGTAGWVIVNTEVPAGPARVTVDAGTQDACSGPVTYTVGAGWYAELSGAGT